MTNDEAPGIKEQMVTFAHLGRI